MVVCGKTDETWGSGVEDSIVNSEASTCRNNRKRGGPTLERVKVLHRSER